MEGKLSFLRRTIFRTIFQLRKKCSFQNLSPLLQLQSQNFDKVALCAPLGQLVSSVSTNQTLSREVSPHLLTASYNQGTGFLHSKVGSSLSTRKQLLMNSEICCWGSPPPPTPSISALVHQSSEVNLAHSRSFWRTTVLDSRLLCHLQGRA